MADYRVEFSKWWTNEFKAVKYPTEGTVFNYYVDCETKRFLPWKDMVKPYDLDYDVPLQVKITNSKLLSTECAVVNRIFFLTFMKLSFHIQNVKFEVSQQ